MSQGRFEFMDLEGSVCRISHTNNTNSQEVGTELMWLNPGLTKCQRFSRDGPIGDLPHLVVQMGHTRSNQCFGTVLLLTSIFQHLLEC